jgi:cytochrome c oxidase subunit 2
MHGFYVPEFRIKQDAIPGKVTTVRFRPTLIGNFQVVCSELCGTGHSTMTSPLRIVSKADFDKFLQEKRDAARAAALNPRRPERGKQLFVSKYACAGCHVLADAGSTGTTGPNLDGIATRAGANELNRLTASSAKDAEEYLRLSIVNPNLFVVPNYPSNIMPRTWNDPNQMPDDDREAILLYLLQQK